MLKDNASKNNQKRTQRRKNDGLLRLLAPTLIGVLIFTVCLCGTTWAWFSATLQGDVARIQAASFEISVELADSEASPIIFSSTDAAGMTQELEPGKLYTVTITSTGSAKTGHCVVTLGGTEYPTTAFTKGGPLIFQVSSAAGGVLSFGSCCWGSYSGPLTDFVTANCVLTDAGILSSANELPTESAEPTEGTTEAQTAEPTDSAEPEPPVTQPTVEAVTAPATQAQTESPTAVSETADPNA